MFFRKRKESGLLVAVFHCVEISPNLSKLVQTCSNWSKFDETNTFFLFIEEVVIVTTSDNVVEKKKRTRTTSVAVFHGVDGNPLERNVVENITQFQVRSNLLKLV